MTFSVMKVGVLFFISMFQIGVCQDPIEIAGQIENLDSEIEDAKIVVRSFLSAEKTDDLVKMIRESERVGPLVKSFYKSRGELSKTGIEEIRNYNLFTLDGFRSVEILCDDFTRRSMVLEKTTNGFKVDWESWVGYSDIGWREFQNKKSDGAFLFRGTIQPDDYYNYQFSDRKVWSCYKFTSPDEEQILYVYVAKGGKDDVQLGSGAFRVKAPSGKYGVSRQSKEPLTPVDLFKRVTISLKFPSDSKSKNQVVIHGGIREGWVTVSPKKKDR